MNRKHTSLIALLLGLAAVLGTFAALRTAHLGASVQRASSAQIVAQQRRLTAAERALKHTLALKQVGAQRARKTIYVRPAPIIVHLRRHGDDGESGSDD